MIPADLFTACAMLDATLTRWPALPPVLRRQVEALRDDVFALALRLATLPEERGVLEDDAPCT